MTRVCHRCLYVAWSAESETVSADFAASKEVEAAVGTGVAKTEGTSN